MKKIIFGIVILCLQAYWGRCQAIGPDLRDITIFGLKAGTNYSNIYDTYGNDFSATPIFGFTAGGFLSIPLGTYVGIQPEVLFSQKGYQGTTIYQGTAYTYVRTLNYYDIPIFLQLKPSRRVSLLVGPQYSYLIEQKDVYNNESNSVEQITHYQNNNVRRNTLCFVAGLDVYFRHMVLCGRVAWDVQDNNGDGTSISPRYKNVWEQFTLGYRFYD